MIRPEEIAQVVADTLQEASLKTEAQGDEIIVYEGNRPTLRFTIKEDGSVLINHEKEAGEAEWILKKYARAEHLKISGKLYGIHSLDVWGNEEDGFEVNEIYSKDQDLEIPTQATNSEIIRILKEEGFINKTAKNENIEIDDSGDEIWINDARTGEPIYNLKPS